MWSPNIQNYWIFTKLKYRSEVLWNLFQVDKEEILWRLLYNDIVGRWETRLNLSYLLILASLVRGVWAKWSLKLPSLLKSMHHIALWYFFSQITKVRPFSYFVVHPYILSDMQIVSDHLVEFLLEFLGENCQEQNLKMNKWYIHRSLTIINYVNWRKFLSLCTPLLPHMWIGVNDRIMIIELCCKY